MAAYSFTDYNKLFSDKTPFRFKDSYRVKGVYFQGRPLDCIICEWTESDREINRECYDVPNLPSEDLDVLECNHTAPFCKTEFTFFNG